MKNTFFHIIILVSIFTNTYAQISINNNGANPDASAMLDVSSTTKGVLIPRMTSNQRTMISSIATGLMVFDTDTKSFWFYNGSSWSELQSKSRVSMLSDANNDTKVQTEESPNDDVIRIDINGSEELVIKTNANGNPMLEFQDDNIFIGNEAGNSHDNGINNIYYGDNSGNKNVTGSNNTFFGYYSGANMTAGSDNVLVGYNAGLATTSGSNNVYLGTNAGNGTGGNNNVMIGYSAGLSSSGNGNVYIGYNAGKQVNDDNTLQIRDTKGSVLLSGDFDANTLTFDATPIFNDNIVTNDYWISGNGSNNGLFIASDGKVGIGTSTPTHQLTINGNLDVYASDNRVKFNNGSFLMTAEVETKFASIRVNGGNGSKSSHYTTSNWISTSKSQTGKYNITFASGTFVNRPVIVGIAGGNNRLVIASADNNSAVIEVRDTGGNLVNSEFMLHIWGE
jgi:hypothetical protein